MLTKSEHQVLCGADPLELLLKEWSTRITTADVYVHLRLNYEGPSPSSDLDGPWTLDVVTGICGGEAEEVVLASVVFQPSIREAGLRLLNDFRDTEEESCSEGDGR